MRGAVKLAGLTAATPAGAERLNCTLYRSAPPLRRITRVVADGETYAANQILTTDSTREFYANLPDRERSPTISLDGAAIYTDTAEKHRHTGTCRETAE